VWGGGKAGDYFKGLPITIALSIRKADYWPNLIYK